MRNLARAGGNKPPLQPLPIDPAMVAHAEACRARTAAAIRRNDISGPVAKGCTAVLELLRDQERTVAEISVELNFSKPKTRYIVRTLQESGLIAYSGRSTATRWRVLAQQVSA